jgi:D-glycero-D-manno-heptose 1,7-bisphosphate phosphatase
VFLDRDGVINQVVVRDGRPYPPPSVAELKIMPRVSESIDALKVAGFRTIVVTNQPDVATGVQRREVVEAMHEVLLTALRIDDIRVCFHTDRDGCTCRKPKPGMLLEAASDWDVDLGRSYMVGDRWRDIDAGREAGCRTILVGGGYAEREAEAPDAVADSLHEAAKLILSEQNRNASRSRIGGDPWRR